MSTDPSASRRKAPIERAAEIARAAREIALDEGLSALTLRAVASRIGVTPALVSHYQPSMDSLVASTFGAIVAAEIGEVAEELAPCETAVAALQTLIDTLLGPERSTVTAVWLDAWSLGRRHPALAVEVGVQMDAWQAFLAVLLHTGCARGEFRAIDPDAVAWQLLAIIDGLNAHAIVRYGHAQRLRGLVRTVAEHELGLRSGALGPGDDSGRRPEPDHPPAPITVPVC
ncbi:TetR family transcriptional regulator [Cryobacterium sp. TMT1-62]|uniref:TetR/AcrR family transcriptional regulator n=1 Tax=unclassified Cryobacterium TaxID=2649013 RepID=UPI00106B70C7|nr:MULTISPECIES: TetR/AcrR family transcriptional regulator [unclassified Cryobacterium]TFC53191.1 TetR family transcriptional regulator [Cryobacterium sp. TMT2-17-1]TFD31890.1 TetR family transcriptional regulator [Cryobacterium sp. TMT1-62]